MFLAERLGLAPELVATIRVAGLLHDVGKIGVPDGILRKPGSLTAEEYAIVKQHVALGDLIVRDLPDVELIRAGVRHHHERWDGDGYLDRLAGEEIPLVARILAVGDAFSAMTTTRPYRKALATDEALRRLEDAAGTQLDERLVDAVRRRHRDDRWRAAARRRCRVPPAVDAVPPGRLMPAREVAPGPRRRRRASAGLVAIVALMAVAGVSAGPGRAAASTWTITLTPSTIEAVQATTIKATFWNLGGPDGQQDLGCVRIAIPTTFTVGSTQVDQRPAEHDVEGLERRPDDGHDQHRERWRTTAPRPSGRQRDRRHHRHVAAARDLHLDGECLSIAGLQRPVQRSREADRGRPAHTLADADADAQADTDPDVASDGDPDAAAASRRSPPLPTLPPCRPSPRGRPRRRLRAPRPRRARRVPSATATTAATADQPGSTPQPARSDEPAPNGLPVGTCRPATIRSAGRVQPS